MVADTPDTPDTPGTPGGDSKKPETADCGLGRPEVRRPINLNGDSGACA